LRLNEQKNRSRKAAEVAAGDWVELTPLEGTTIFTGYEHLEEEVQIVKFREVVSKKKKTFEIVLNKTPFYAESGGQAGDTGWLKNENETIEVLNTLKENNLIVHLTEVLPLFPEKPFFAGVDAEKRLATANNHTATHLMHSALRQVLGTHVEQKGSLVNFERLRFDFSHFGKVTSDELKAIEKIVNKKIRENIQRTIHIDVPVEEAKSMGAMALFGEKYGDFVRVISFDPSYSVELCGGTHTESTGHIGSFRIVSEGAIAAGVRRIEAVTAQAAEDYVNKFIEEHQQIREIVKTTGDLVKGIVSLTENYAEVLKKNEALLQEKAITISKQLLSKSIVVNDFQLIVAEIDESIEMAKSIALQIKAITNNTAVLLHGKAEGKAMICLMFTDDLVLTKNLDASAYIKTISKEIQGGGGGQKHLATAGGKNLSGISTAVNIILSELNKL